jgi:uncharacterized protein (DUF1697 family)
MNRYVAFLRGMNLGGRRIKNDSLRAEFEQLGFIEVTTFRASGNVIFAFNEEPLSAGILTERIEAGLLEALGYEVSVFLRTVAEVAEIAAQRPFKTKQGAASRGNLQVSLLLRKPSAKASKAVLARSTKEDLLAIEGCQLYWLPSGGTIDSDLDLKAIEAELGRWTMRTKGTIDQIAVKHCVV